MQRVDAVTHDDLDVSRTEIDECIAAACQDQAMFSGLLAEAYGLYQFERLWVELDSATQRTLLHQAIISQEASETIARISHQGLPLDSMKNNCPELVMEELLDDEGRPLLRLMEQLLVDNNKVRMKRPAVTHTHAFSIRSSPLSHTSSLKSGVPFQICSECNMAGRLTRYSGR